ncbi:MAG TPA: cryptochrome/photolyase family protein, partial [Acidobacteriota bacterium]|nr:cryptochrome/photolyase family protein [Acidobacteriota bacterium]
RLLLVETRARTRDFLCHKHKLILVWSAMRHWAREMEQQGWSVDYRPQCRGFRQGLKAHIQAFQPRRLRLMETAEYGRADQIASMARDLGLPVEMTPNNAFLSDKREFAEEAKDRKSLVMETFYRGMRRRTGLLMEAGRKPAGGAWNFDKKNRKTPPDDHDFPEVKRFQPDGLTRDVMELVEEEFAGHFGRSDSFFWPVTHGQARAFLDDFLEQRLDLFGPYQDAIVRGQPVLYHSLLSSLLNIGLLEPLEVCRLAEERYRKGEARIESVEGFIRQIIGWREFIYQVYHLKMPGYIESNQLEADLPLPEFYWTGDTDMACVADAVGNLKSWGTNHHIQRLMVTGNFALTAGIDPQQVNDWYLAAYADAYEWVVTPNVLGMALYADAGFLATKPYAASANYINKMSDCCSSCRYSHRESTGDKACPFNALYWDFLARNRVAFSDNPRMNLVMANLEKRRSKDLPQLRDKAREIRRKLAQGERL